MIHANLSVLLAERNLRISTVSKETGISRTTLTALSSGTCKGVQLETLNTLCAYLQVTPSDILVYYPLDMEIKFNAEDIYTADSVCHGITTFYLVQHQTTVNSSQSVPQTFNLKTKVYKSTSQYTEREVFVIDIQCPPTFARLYDNIPISFSLDIEEQLFNAIKAHVPFLRKASRILDYDVTFLNEYDS